MRFVPRLSWTEWLIISLVFVILAMIAIPNLVRARETSCLNSIASNLRIIEGAKEQWAREHQKLPTDPVSLTDLNVYFKNNVVPGALVGETYVVSTVGALATVTLPGGATLNGKPGPFTTTSF